MTIFTIGHSTHSLQHFVEMLKSFEIEVLVDVRSYPGSRYMPHFNKEDMKNWLLENEIKYIHLLSLGGRRRKLQDIDISLIEGWRHIGFRNYSAYTLTKDFENGLDELIKIARLAKTCIMCAESVPWKCHRLIISNNLSFRGIKVYHIMEEEKTIKHEINKYGAKAKICGDKLTYPKLE